MLHNVVEGDGDRRRPPKPKVVVIRTDALNALRPACGPTRRRSRVTRGLLKTLPGDQLPGVIAHGWSHVLNLDTRYMAAVASYWV